MAATDTRTRRLTLAVLFSAGAHLFVLLAVGFTWQPPHPRSAQPMLDIALVREQPEPEPPPEKPEFIANADRSGGGEQTAAGRREPVTPQPPAPKPPASPPPAEPAPEPQPSPQPAPAPEPGPEPPEKPEVAGKAEEKAAPPEPEPQPEKPPKRELSATDILRSSQEVAANESFSHSRSPGESDFPDKRRISASTREHAAAAYMRSWIDKIERIGNMNYPEEARRRGLGGRLILEVTLRPDGSVVSVDVLEPSRYPVLDQAAQRIVDLAAPFAPVPERVLKGNDLLVITRTWEFSRGQNFSTH
ncbi:hypothetical protein KBTX_03610 [wastewater metagenome]|uniref:TonB C-terminal domain-containing protein n=2 Tax=unclassified sequences TaxID=12908 RepID=A0A5B8RF48_9ZZZZ|nr:MULTISPECIES: energy transducer TonB [Arhodomonas]MCS4505561.1 energy transducer TonB [Arhodomonas aquaeolei]QEA07261.1 hypothetical protein KBTEX_03610 [uncultured organism]